MGTLVLRIFSDLVFIAQIKESIGYCMAFPFPKAAVFHIQEAFEHQCLVGVNKSAYN